MTDSATPVVRSSIPARVDRLPWSPFHSRMVVALGTAWLLEGLEISIASSVADTLQGPDTLGLSAPAVGLIATVYLIGEVVGALFFGDLADRLGRRKLFIITLGVYLIGSGLTAFTFGNSVIWLIFLYLTRFIAGMGIGGEYSAIHSAIDELTPAKYRGRVDIGVSGTYWGGAFLGTLATAFLLSALPPQLGWRLGFLLGPVLAIVIIFVRKNLPESPRWLVMHGRTEEAEENVTFIEGEVERQNGISLPEVDDSEALEIKPSVHRSYFALAKVLFKQYPSRSILGASLMISQSFLYNAIYFTAAIVLGTFFNVPTAQVPLYLAAFAVGNLVGPLVIGRYFDTIGRRKMIAGTYLLSGVLLAISAVLFQSGVLTALTQTIIWVVIFFFASAGASAGYLTVSELFPVEVRAQAIAVFFAIAQCFGAIGPVLYAGLIGDGSDPGKLFIGYLIGAGVMIAGGLVAVFLGVDAENRSLEDVATPLSAVRDATGGSTGDLRPPRPEGAT